MQIGELYAVLPCCQYNTLARFPPRLGPQILLTRSYPYRRIAALIDWKDVQVRML
jgi:hypothetical protein